MLSILIPTYNYDITQLVKNLHEQVKACDIPFEILCIDDGSKEHYSNTNAAINSLEHTSYIINSTNQGRTATRHQLSTKASYKWLLWLDADTQPKHTNFIKQYLSYTNSDYDAIYGGFAYHKTPPESHMRLRWEYGRQKEEQDASIRNKRPYKTIISANFLIKKSLFQTISSRITGHNYGQDNHFGALLKTTNSKVLHIPNEVYHLGFESSISYIKKKEDAARTLLDFYYSDNTIKHDNDLLYTFTRLKKNGVTPLFSWLFRKLQKSLLKNLTSNKPNITFLQLYRLGFMCEEDRKRNV